ncbi:MAG: hypothetical protein C4530_12430 [Desulfobacteraceae bacterium]|nr:MAG: hypothetical protein C4530_12430 [Desulfobacteraceae bacterium]
MKSNEQKAFKKGVVKMNKRKLNSLFILGIIGLISLPAAPGLTADKPIVLKFAHNDSATLQTVKQAGALAMKYFLEKESAGRLKMEVYPAGQLGGEKENVEGTMNGTIQITAASDGALASFVPEIMSASVPYSVKSPAVMWDVLDNSKWSDDLKVVVKRASKIATTVMRSTSQFNDVVGVDILVGKGMQVTYLTPEQLELFRTKAQEAVKSFIVGKIGEEWVKKFGEACKEAEERLAKEN